MKMEEHKILIRDATKDDLLALTNLMKDLGYPTSFEEMKIRFHHILSIKIIRHLLLVQTTR